MSDLCKKYGDIMKLRLYEMLDIRNDATEVEIRKAFRRKALVCHPDKNPDSPTAAAEFVKLQKALEILLDKASRAAYDKLVQAKARPRGPRIFVRTPANEKLRTDVNKREDEAREKAERAEKFARELARLETEGAQIVEDEMARLLKQARHMAANASRFAAGLFFVPKGDEQLNERLHCERDSRDSSPERHSPHYSPERQSPYTSTERQTPYNSKERQTPYSSTERETPYNSTERQTPYNSTERQTPYNSKERQTPYSSTERHSYSTPTEASSSSGNVHRVKVQWVASSDDVAYTSEQLRTIFYKWGIINAVVSRQKRKKGNALIDYQDSEAMEMAINYEVGRPDCPLTVTKLAKPAPPPPQAVPVDYSTGPKPRDYEPVADMVKRRKNERALLMEQIRRSDGVDDD